MMRRAALVLALLLPAGAALASPPVASDKPWLRKQTLDPDWPCQSIKRTDLSVAEIWAGPPIDAAAMQAGKRPAISTLAGRLAQRRVPLEDAKSEIVAFAQSAGAQKQERLVALFAGLFDALNQERESVVSGLDRFGVRQKQIAGGIRTQEQQLTTLQSAAQPNQPAIDNLADRIAWAQQMFDERRQSLQYACAVPDVIEQRLYALAQAIQAQLP